MVVSRFHTPEVLKFAGRLYTVRRPAELTEARTALGKDYHGIDAMVAFPYYDEEPYFSQYVVPLALQEYVAPYLCQPYVYFTNGERSTDKPLEVDHTLILDTNFAGYISKFIKERSYKGLKREIAYCIDAILYHDLKIDYTLYLLENINKAHQIAEAIRNNKNALSCQFWESMDQSLKHNITNLELLRNADCTYYRKTRELKFNISIEDAVSRSINDTYNFYSSEETQELINDFRFRQQAILLQLLAMLKIQLSSAGSPGDKTREFLAYIHDEGIYLDRETVIAYKYFQHPGIIPLLDRINRGSVQEYWLDKMENLASNMTAPRLMERMTGVKGEYEYLVPLFLSFDRKMSELVRCYPIKAVIIDRSSGSVLSIAELNTIDYFQKEGCPDIVENFFSAEMVEERYSRFVPTLEIMSQRILSEYREINKILNSQI